MVSVSCSSIGAPVITTSVSTTPVKREVPKPMPCEAISTLPRISPRGVLKVRPASTRNTWPSMRASVGGITGVPCTKRKCAGSTTFSAISWAWVRTR